MDVKDLGKTTASFDSVTLSIYDRERTICDCFKYRSQPDSEMFGKAINVNAADDCNYKNWAACLCTQKSLDCICA